MDLKPVVFITGHATWIAYGDQLITLSPKEQVIVAALARAAGRIVSKGQFMTALYPHGDEAIPKILDVFVCKIRRKLKAAGIPQFIGTVWGVGYTIQQGSVDVELEDGSKTITPNDVSLIKRLCERDPDSLLSEQVRVSLCL